MEKTIQVALAFALLFAGMEIGKRLAANIVTPTTAAPTGTQTAANA